MACCEDKIPKRKRTPIIVECEADYSCIRLVGAHLGSGTTRKRKTRHHPSLVQISVPCSLHTFRNSSFAAWPPFWQLRIHSNKLDRITCAVAAHSCSVFH